MDVTEPARPSAFSTLADTLIAPREAFIAIREYRYAFWAIAATIVLAALASWIETPALRHVMEATTRAAFANSPQIASLPPDEAAAKIQKAVDLQRVLASYLWLVWIVGVPVFCVLWAAVLFAIRALVRSHATFGQLFALNAHVQFVSLGLGSIVLGALIVLRPAATYHAQLDFESAMPSLAWLLPSAPVQLWTFLAGFTPFSVWGTVLMALGLVAVAGFERRVAWATALGVLAVTSGLAAAFAR